jgi:UDP-glucose 4-epimerase
MLWIALQCDIKRVVFSSSSSVYGDAKIPTSENHPLNPLSPYALNKIMGEQYCKLYSDIYNVDTVCLRYFNAYGDRMNNEGGYKLVMPIFKEQILNNKPLTINNDGEQRRDFIHVDDIVNANILVAKHKSNFKGNIYNVGSGKNYSVNEIADMFGGNKTEGNKVIEPFETLADISKIDLDLNWKSKGDLKKWIKKYLKNE